MWWRKTMHMLGLDEPVDYDAMEHVQRPDVARSAEVSAVSGSVTALPSGQVNVAAAPSTDEHSGLGSVRPIRTDISGSSPAVRPSVVRPVPMPANAKPHRVTPASFNEAQAIADSYKNDRPVIMDLHDADRGLARRLVDFASGLCYGLGGQMERIDGQVYLLTPSRVTVSEEERRRLRERGFDA